MSSLVNIFESGTFRRLSALADQGAVSLLTFGSMMLAGIVLEIHQFAEYAITIASAALVQTVVTCLITAPTIHLVNSNTTGLTTGIIRSICLIHGLIVSGTLSIILIAGEVWLTIPTKQLIVALLLGLFWASFELNRKLWISENRADYSMLTSLSSLVVLAIAVSTAYLTGTLSSITFATSLAIAYLIPSAGSTINLLRSTPQAKNIYPIGDLLKIFWQYSSLLLIGVGVYWIYTQGFLFIAISTLSAQDFGKLRLIISITSMSTVIMAYMESHFTPTMCRAASTDSIEKMIDVYLPLQKSARIIGIAYALLWTIVTQLAFHFFYSAKYGEISLPLTFAACVGQFALILARPPIIYFRAVANSRSTLLAHIACGATIFGLGVFAMDEFGIAGAILAISSGYIVFFATVEKQRTVSQAKF